MEKKIYNRKQISPSCLWVLTQTKTDEKKFMQKKQVKQMDKNIPYNEKNFDSKEKQLEIHIRKLQSKCI